MPNIKTLTFSTEGHWGTLIKLILKVNKVFILKRIEMLSILFDHLMYLNTGNYLQQILS